MLGHRVGLSPAIDRLSSSSVVVLLYHKVQRRPTGLWGEPVLSVAEFDQHLTHLARHHTLVPLAQVVKWLAGEASLPDRAVAITFDDGYRNNLLLAAPVLRRHRAPATFFVSTGLIGTDRWMWAYELEEMFLRFSLPELGRAFGHPMMADLCGRGLPREVLLSACVDFLKTLEPREVEQLMERLRRAAPVEVDDENRFLSWEEVRALHAMGFDIGGHGVTHSILVRQSLADAEAEVAGCKEALERELGRRPTLFAYPNGDTNARVSAMVGRHFSAAVTTVPSVCSRRNHLLELPRVCAPVTVAELSFELTRHFFRDTRAGFAGAVNELRRDDASVRADLSPKSPAHRHERPPADPPRTTSAP